MAMTGTATNLSPRHYSDNLNSPHSRRAARSIVSSPWNQIVRGELEPIVAAPNPSPSPPTSTTVIESAPVTSASLPVEDSSSVGDSIENGSGSNGNTGKRPAWNKPSNGAASEVKPVMGAVSWPALSESTRVTMKSSSESLKGLIDGSSVPKLQVTGSSPSSSERQFSDNSITNTTVPTRQKSMKRNGSNVSSNAGHPQQSASQASIAITGSHNSSPKGHTQRSAFVSHPNNVNDHPQQPNSFRNRNGGPNHREDGAHHHNYGNRREQDRSNQDWNTHRNFNGRDTHMPARVVPTYIRPPPPPNSAQFVSPPPMRPYAGPFGFSELASPVIYVAAPPPESLRTVPFVQTIPPHGMFFPAPDPQLHTKIVNQIDYYFSNENLIKDTYLRQNMDDQGWVPIKLIAGFNKVMQLTDNIQIILDALRVSSVVEVQGDKIRRRNDWKRWVMPASVQFPHIRSPQPLGKFGHEILTQKFQSSLLEKTTENDGACLDTQTAALENRPAFRDLNSSLQQSGGEGTGQVSIQGSNHSISARN